MSSCSRSWVRVGVCKQCNTRHQTYEQWIVGVRMCEWWWGGGFCWGGGCWGGGGWGGWGLGGFESLLWGGRPLCRPTSFLSLRVRVAVNDVVRKGIKRHLHCRHPFHGSFFFPLSSTATCTLLHPIHSRWLTSPLHGEEGFGCRGWA